MDKHPPKKPPLIGVYGVNNEDIKVAYLYERDKEKPGTNINDMMYHDFKPVDHVYNILAEGHKPFYASDYVHVGYWEETEGTLENLDDMYLEQYHCGRRAYFEYCREYGIDAPYIQELTSDKEFCPTECCLKNFERQLPEWIDEKMKKCGHIEAVALKNYEYLLNEPFYNDLALGYMLEDESGTISFFPYDSSSMILI